MASTHFDSSLLVANYDWNADRPIPTKKRSYVRKKLDAVEGDAPMPRPSNASPSLAPVTVTEVTDEDIGLETTKTTQKAAEEFVRSAISFKTWKAAKDRQRATEVKAKRLEMIREAAARFTLSRSKPQGRRESAIVSHSPRKPQEAPRTPQTKPRSF